MVIIIKTVACSHPYTPYMQTHTNGGWGEGGCVDRTEDTKKKTIHLSASSQQLLCFFASPWLSLPLCPHLIWSVWSWSALMPDWDKYPNMHTEKEREWEWRSGEEAVDLRGQMKECRYVLCWCVPHSCFVSHFKQRLLQEDHLHFIVIYNKCVRWESESKVDGVSRRKSGWGSSPSKGKRQHCGSSLRLSAVVSVCLCVWTFWITWFSIEGTCVLWTFFSFNGFMWV